MSMTDSIYICKYCGKSFSELPSKYASGNFCSKECARKYSSQLANTEEKRLEKSNSLKEYNSIHKRKTIHKEIANKTKKEIELILSQIQSMYEDYNFYDMSKIINIPTNRIKSIAKKHNIEENKKFLPAIKTSATSFCKLVLNKNTSVTYDDFYIVKQILEDYLYKDNLSPQEIQNIYKTSHKNFTDFLKTVFHIKMRNYSKAVCLHYYKIGAYNNKTEKELYKIKASFSFGLEDFKKVKGFELVQKYGMYSSTNINGVARDHMISMEYGWENNIPPEVIAHPANCEIIIQRNNSSKGKNCSISLEELYERIKNWNI